MFVLRNQPKGARFASFGLGLCVFALMPTEIGYQDIASLLARQPGVAERWQKRMFSAAGSIQVATFSFARPIGTASPQTATYRLALDQWHEAFDAASEEQVDEIVGDFNPTYDHEEKFGGCKGWAEWVREHLERELAHRQ